MVKSCCNGNIICRETALGCNVLRISKQKVDYYPNNMNDVLPHLIQCCIESNKLRWGASPTCSSSTELCDSPGQGVCGK